MPLNPVGAFVCAPGSFLPRLYLLRRLWISLVDASSALSYIEPRERRRNMSDHAMVHHDIPIPVPIPENNQVRLPLRWGVAANLDPALRLCEGWV